jgi:hypothetical protein
MPKKRSIIASVKPVYLPEPRVIAGTKMRQMVPLEASLPRATRPRTVPDSENVAKRWARLAAPAHRDALERGNPEVAISLPALKKKAREHPEMLTGPEIAAASHHRLKGFTNQVTMASARQ